MSTLRKMWVVLFYMGLVVSISQSAQQALTSEELNLPIDTSTRLAVRELRISGNTLISTSELLEYMPAVYNASGQPLSKADSQYLYDLRPIQEIVAAPGQPREVSLRTIQGLTQYILSVYQANNYSGIYVYVPEGAIQDGNKLVDGILPINVLEAPVSEVRIKYYDAERNEVEEGYLRRSALEEWSPIERDKVASQKKLDYLVNLLNLNPDRHVSAVVSRGAEPNTLAVQYDVYETSPWHFFIRADNSDRKERQWSPLAGIINTNLLGIDDQFAVYYKFDLDSMSENYAVGGSYDFPIMGPRLRLALRGSYQESSTDTKFDVDTPISFLGSGTNYEAELRYNIYQEQNWFFDITGSYGNRDVENNVEFGGFPTQTQEVDLDLWGAGVDIHHRDDISITSLKFNYTQSDGKVDDYIFGRSDENPDASIYSTLVQHSQYVDQNKVEQLRSTFRWIEPSDRLVNGLKTYFGGMYTVRGYDEYEIIADGGILASIQYEYDLVRHNQVVEPKAAAIKELKRLAPLAFFDYGRAKIEKPIPGLEKGSQTLYSVGVGLAFEVGNNFSGALYYGHPLKDTDETNSGHGRLNASAMLRW